MIDEDLEAEWNAAEPVPMSKEQYAHILRSTLNARWCDGCCEKRPFDPEQPERWSEQEDSGVTRRLCGICTRHGPRYGSVGSEFFGAIKRRQAAKGGTFGESGGQAEMFGVKSKGE